MHNLKYLTFLLSRENDFPEVTDLKVPMFIQRNFDLVDAHRGGFNSSWPINLEKIEQVYNGLDWHEDSNYISVRAKLASSLSRIPSFRACYFEDFNNDNNPDVLINFLKTCNGDDVDLINSVLTRIQSQKSLSIHQMIDLAKTCYKIGRQHQASSFLNEVCISLGLTKEGITKNVSARNLKFPDAAMFRNKVDLLFQLADAYCDCEDFAVAKNLIAYVKKLEDVNRPFVSQHELSKIQTLVYLKIGQQDKAYQRFNYLICHPDSNIQMKGLAILNYVLDS